MTEATLWIWATVLCQSQSLHAQEAARSSSVGISKQYTRVRKRGSERERRRERARARERERQERYSARVEEGRTAALVSRHPTPRPPPSRTHLAGLAGAPKPEQQQQKRIYRLQSRHRHRRNCRRQSLCGRGSTWSPGRRRCGIATITNKRVKFCTTDCPNSMTPKVLARKGPQAV